MTVTEPSGVVHFVGRNLIPRQLLLPGCGRLELPVVEAVEEHLGQVVHHLPLLRGEMVELVQHEVGHTLGDTRLLVRRVPQGSFHARLGPLENTATEKFEQIEVDLLGVVVLLLVDTHEEILHVHNDAKQSVQLVLPGVVEVADVGGEGVLACPARVARGAGRLGGVWPAIYNIMKINSQYWTCCSYT